MTYKTQKIITKWIKQFDLRLFEEIGGNVHQNQKAEENKKSTLRAFASRPKNQIDATRMHRFISNP